MPKNNVDNIKCSPDISIKEALGVLNSNKGQILLVTNKDEKLIGTVTDGDIRRALLKNISLPTPVSEIMHTDPAVISQSKVNSALEYMKKHGVRQLPVVENSGRVVDIILLIDIISSNPPVSEKENYVFIPAGGKGTRLDPFTKILPKPLIPIGDKPVIETILEKFQKQGFNRFLISLNYKADMIKSYFAENHHNFQIEYIHEDKELGTAGSLSLIKGKASDSILISNCDVITDMDFSALLDFHKRRGFQMTVAGALRHVKIPYGVLEIKDQAFEEIVEKPEYDVIINSGIYVIEPEVIDMITDDAHLGMPNLLKKAKDGGFKVGVYPYSGEWLDIGQWEEYKKAIEHFKFWNI